MTDECRLQTAHILYVEDNPVNRNLFKAMLESKVGTLVMAESGDEGLVLLEEHCKRVNLVITDLNMPGMDGETFIGHVRERHPELPVIILSAYGDVTDLKDVHAILIKPFDRKDIIRKILEAI